VKCLELSEHCKSSLLQRMKDAAPTTHIYSKLCGHAQSACDAQTGVYD
jgi:hypothetical protein